MSRFTRALTGLLAVCTALFIAGALPLLAQSPLHGAWQHDQIWGENDEGEWQVENLQPSVYIFLDGHYSIMYVRGEEARPLLPEDASRSTLTEEQMRSAFMPFVANSGTYTIEGSTVTMTPMVALWPNFMESGSASWSFRMQDGALLLSASGESGETNIRMTRLE